MRVKLIRFEHLKKIGYTRHKKNIRSKPNLFLFVEVGKEKTKFKTKIKTKKISTQGYNIFFFCLSM